MNAIDNTLCCLVLPRAVGPATATTHGTCPKTRRPPGD